MPLNDVLLGELRSGLPRLQGARVSAVLPVYRTVIEEVLPLLPGLPDGVSLTLGTDQQVQVRYGSFYANATLHPDVSLRPTPVVTLELASQLVAWGLQRAPLPPFVRLSGRLVHIWLAEMPALADVAPLWPHVASLTCRSTAGGLQIDARIHVAGAGQPLPAFPRSPRTHGDRPMTEGRLQAWLRHQVETGLPALAGARIAGTVPLPVTLLNELLAEAVADAAEGRSAGTSAAPRGGPDLATLARMVRHVRVDAGPGVVTVDFAVGADG